MAQGRRSPFGELLYRHRRRLAMSQRDVAERALDLTMHDKSASPLTERTVSALERQASDPARWRFPRLSTARTLAKVFDLAPGSPDYDEFLAAASGDHAPGKESQSTSPTPRPPGDLTAISPEFVAAGREPHLARLRDAVDAAVGGSTGAVFVSSDPGSGKTWLIEETCRQTLARHPGAVVLWTECSGRLGTADPHHPFRQMLGLMVGDLRNASPRQCLSDRNVERIKERIPDAAAGLAADGGALIHRFVAAETIQNRNLMKILDDDRWQALESAIQRQGASDHAGSSLNESFFRMLARYAEAGPVVLVLDDLHWADPGTSSVLFHILQRLHQQSLPVVVLGSFRPGDLGPSRNGERHPLPAVLHEVARLYPDPVLDLSTAVGGSAGRAFVDAVIARSGDAYPPHLADTLFKRTAGLPLFVTGLLRLYGQDGALDDELPAEIQTVFFEQVDRLSPQAQRLLEAASVQGDTFSAETLMQVLDLDRDSLIDVVDEHLVRRYRLIAPGSRSTIAGQAVHWYQFSHALLRDFIYGSMTDLEHSHYHASTAEAMRALYGPYRHAGTATIALHYEQAGNSIEAARAWLHAGDHAMYVGEYDRAMRHFERIDDRDLIAADPTVYGQSLVGLGNCARALGDLEHARAMFDRAYDFARRRKLALIQAHALTSMGLLDFDAGQLRMGADRLSAAIDLYVEVGNGEDAARGLANLSYLLHGMGSYGEAIDAARRACDTAEELGHDALYVDARIALANCWIDVGRSDDAIEAYEQCVAICRELNDARRETICWLNIALAAFELGRLDRTEAAIEHALEPGRSVLRRFVGVAEFLRGLVAERRGEIAAARAHYETSREIRERNGQEALLVDSLAGLLRTAVACGDDAQARALLADIQERIETDGLDGIEHAGRLHVTLIEAASALGDAEQARERATQALAFLTDRAGRLSDPADRESYLTKVPSNLRIMELASSMGLDGDTHSVD